MEPKRRMFSGERPPIQRAALLVTPARHGETELPALVTYEAEVNAAPDST
jgi:hypothetical protein